MSDVVTTAVIAGTAGVAGAAVPTITSYLAGRAEREKAVQEHGFDRDRSWEQYQIGLRACYRKLLNNIERANVTDGLISTDDIGKLRENYYEAYFAGDDWIVKLSRGLLASRAAQ